MLQSSMERKGTESAFGNFYIHLMIETDMVIFKYDYSCGAKGLIKQWILRFVHAFFPVYPQQLHMKGDLPSEIFLHYTPGVAIWIHMSSRPSCTQKMKICSIIRVFGLFFFLECCVCVSPPIKMRFRKPGHIKEADYLSNCAPLFLLLSFKYANILIGSYDESQKMHSCSYFSYHQLLAFFIPLYAHTSSHYFILHFWKDYFASVLWSMR